MLLRHFVLAFCVVFAFNASAEWYDDYQQGIHLINKGNWAGAIRNLQNAIRQKDQEAGILNLYGKTYGDYYPHYYLAMAQFYSEQYHEAVVEFDKSIGFGEIQKNPELYQKLKELRSLAGVQLAAKETAAETDNNKSLRDWIRIGAKKYFEGNYDDAIALFSQLLRQDPGNASVQFLLGCSYASKYLLSGSQDHELFEKASAAFQNAKRMDPNFAVAENPYISPAILQIYQQS